MKQFRLKINRNVTSTTYMCTATLYTTEGIHTLSQKNNRKQTTKQNNTLALAEEIAFNNKVVFISNY